MARPKTKSDRKSPTKTSAATVIERAPTSSPASGPAEVDRAREGAWPLGDMDVHLFNEGTHAKLYEELGAHPMRWEGRDGTYFAVWAPNAKSVSVIGDFNAWSRSANAMSAKGQSGIWEAFVAGAARGQRYRFAIESRVTGGTVEKSDPFAFHQEVAPAHASIICDLGRDWQDAEWMKARAAPNALDTPISVYEVHLGSWMRVPEEGDRSLTYRELAPALAEYVASLGFTHVELMPVMEHPFYGSWGYQVTGYFAATSRYGTPQDLMFLIDHLHQKGIGVILDWVPAHFPNDAHALGEFDGTHLFEHADQRQGFHPEWKSLIFNYGRNEVRSFLLSSAMFWLDVFHVDGLRVDGVASMLYLDYGRAAGEWIANRHGGKENLEAIAFLRQLNEQVYRAHPDVQTIAEESTSWPMVSRPLYVGGLGFGMKWDMGWMHDTLDYFHEDPVHRKYHHQKLTFRRLYAFHENFMLPLSHDEVVYGKGSLLGKMAGDEWQRFANLRLLFAMMWAQPGKKLLFMGGELAQEREWSHERSLDWHLLERPRHRGVHHLIGELNRLLRAEESLHVHDRSEAGFEWIDANDSEQSVLSFERRGATKDERVVVVANFTPIPRYNYRIGVDRPGRFLELLNTDAQVFGGSGHGNLGGIDATPLPSHGRRFSLNLTLPPLGAIFLKAAKASTK